MNPLKAFLALRWLRWELEVIYGKQSEQLAIMLRDESRQDEIGYYEEDTVITGMMLDKLGILIDDAYLWAPMIPNKEGR